MEIALESPDKNSITEMDNDSIHIAGTRYEDSIIVTNNTIESWQVSSLATLTESHIEPLTLLKEQIIIIGTGTHHHTPPLNLFAPLFAKNKGVEFMSTPAACRTFNALLSENRSVAAALIIDHEKG